VRQTTEKCSSCIWSRTGHLEKQPVVWNAIQIILVAEHARSASAVTRWSLCDTVLQWKYLYFQSKPADCVVLGCTAAGERHAAPSERSKLIMQRLILSRQSFHCSFPSSATSMLIFRRRVAHGGEQRTVLLGTENNTPQSSPLFPSCHPASRAPSNSPRTRPPLATLTLSP